MAQRLSERLQPASARLVAILLLCFAVPGSADVVQDVMLHLADVECCDDDCGDETGECGATTCLHCTCCAHATALLPIAASAGLLNPAPSTLPVAWLVDQSDASEFRAPPFRPPTA